MQASNEKKLIIGIDYGTTGTAVTYALTGQDYRWIQVQSRTGKKVPSTIAYPEENPGLQIPRPQWGVEVGPGVIACSWTKLRLHVNTNIQEYDDPILEDIMAIGILRLPPGKSPVEVVGDYLHLVYQSVQQIIIEERMQNTPIEFWFAVPAIWNEGTQALMNQAITRAGFGHRLQDKVIVTSEPEATAVSVLQENRQYFKTGDAICICDCGGGTVDITCYYITDLSETPCFHELTTAMGGKCGGTAIDREFLLLMRNRFGDCFVNLPYYAVGPGSEFMKKFEMIKEDFDESVTEPYHLRLRIPGIHSSSHYDARRERIILSATDLRGIYNPTIEKIIKLIQVQLAAANEELRDSNGATISKIILSGGFSRSSYLQRMLRHNFDRAIVAPDRNGMLAVSHGLILKGLTGIQPVTQKCWRHYGVATVAMSPSPTSVSWLLEKNARYPQDYSTTTVIQVIHYRGEPLVKSVAMYTSDRLNAPQAVGDAVFSHFIPCNLANVNLDQFLFVSGGNYHGFWTLPLSIRVTLAASRGILRFDVTIRDSPIGQLTIPIARG